MDRAGSWSPSFQPDSWYPSGVRRTAKWAWREGVIEAVRSVIAATWQAPRKARAAAGQSRKGPAPVQGRCGGRSGDAGRVPVTLESGAMLEELLADHLRGKRLLALVAAGIALEVLVVLLSRELGSNQLIGVHGVLGIAIAIAVAIAGGSLAGAIVAGIGAVLFVALVAFAEPPEPRLYGIPVVVLWVGLAIGVGAAAGEPRRGGGPGGAPPRPGG